MIGIADCVEMQQVCGNYKYTKQFAYELVLSDPCSLLFGLSFEVSVSTEITLGLTITMQEAKWAGSSPSQARAHGCSCDPTR